MHSQILPDVDKAKYQALLATIECEGYPNEQGVRQVNVIAHSKGAIDIISVARDHPEHFRNILLVAPGGVVYPTVNPIRALVRLWVGDKRDRKDKAEIEAEGGVAADWLLKNRQSADTYKRDWVRYFLESINAATKSIYQDFQALRDRGIRIALIAQEDDSMFPLEYYQFVSGRVDRFISVPGIHGAIKFDRSVGLKLSMLLKSLEES